MTIIIEEAIISRLCEKEVIHHSFTTIGDQPIKNSEVTKMNANLQWNPNTDRFRLLN